MDLISEFAADPVRFVERLVDEELDVEPLLLAPNRHIDAFFGVLLRMWDSDEQLLLRFGRRIATFAAKAASRYPDFVLARIEREVARLADTVASEPQCAFRRS